MLYKENGLERNTGALKLYYLTLRGLKMHCNSCNVELTDFESTRKDSNGEYLDLCNVCYSTIADDVHTDVRYDLMSEADYVQFNDIEDLKHYIDFD